MNPDEKAALLRLVASAHRKRAAEYDLAATLTITNASFARFAAALQAGVDRDIASHPDLAELNVQMDGFYP